MSRRPRQAVKILARPKLRFSIGGQVFEVIAIEDGQSIINAPCWECGRVFTQFRSLAIRLTAPRLLTRRCPGCRARFQYKRVTGSPAKPESGTEAAAAFEHAESYRLGADDVFS